MPAPLRVTASDGVTLAVHRYTEVDAARPTILAIHGWPDNHHLWDGVASELDRHRPGGYNVVAGAAYNVVAGAAYNVVAGAAYNVVAYDVRGAGESSRPATRSGYAFAQLISDIGAVIDSLGVGRVHLLAHDWGSIQAWAAVTDDSVMPKVASFTSISGPHLRHAGAFLRSARTPRAVGQVVRQLLGSAYIAFFLCPGVPELVFRSRIGVKVHEALERIGASSTRSRRHAPPRSIADYVNGLSLYRANMPGPMLRPGPLLPQTTVAVQVLVPRRDVFVTPALQRFTGAIPRGGRVIEIEGGHWVVTSRPDVIARLTAEWVDRNDGRNASGLVTGG
ncbi:alpha/beta hydrolase [Mycobacterium alsense]|uniref:Alpha/beta fold hydrolase n=1 Tax=Mycobacterium alsense TaxID=324058 RepID=A0AA41XNU6_9MYCO|nr:alpha/beta fold hydrolase [Mycobacterium alsense]MCV7379666.1 alpha/beta fold hydrolase [Mycobacterium alsense]OQZ90450.1 alpha/beta hydrolase [Mycobacterium alsense]